MTLVKALVAGSALLAFAAPAVSAAEDAQQSDRKVTLSIPAEHPAGCFASTARIPREIVPFLPSRAALRFTVAQDGAVRDVSVKGIPSHNLEAYLLGRLASCGWTPAADDRGVPMTVAVNMPVRFEK